MKKVRVLVIGAAFSADLHCDAYSRLRDHMEIVGICDLERERAETLAERYGFAGWTYYSDFAQAIQMCDCDLVDVCMPNHLHHDVVIPALKKGRDVICEKPLATTVEDAEEMVAAAKEMKRHLYYAEDWLYAPAFRKAISLVESGQLGRMLYVRARESHCGSHSPFAQTLHYCGGGCMIHLGVHPIGFMLAMKHNKWKSVTAVTSGGGQTNLAHPEMEGEDFAAAVMQFEDNTFATLEANYVTVGGMEDVMDIYCEKGTIHVNLTFGGPLKVFSLDGLDYTVEKAEITTGWSSPAVDEKYSLGYCGEIAHFVDCVAADTDAQIGLRGADGLEILKVIRAIYRSAGKKKQIINNEEE